MSAIHNLWIRRAGREYGGVILSSSRLRNCFKTPQGISNSARILFYSLSGYSDNCISCFSIIFWPHKLIFLANSILNKVITTKLEITVLLAVKILFRKLSLTIKLLGNGSESSRWERRSEGGPQQRHLRRHEGHHGGILKTSVPDLWQFGVDPDPRIHVSD